MAQHTITISDEEGGVSIRLASEGSRKSVSGITALALIELAKKVMPGAVKTAAELGICNCSKCLAAGNETAPPVGTTLH